MFDDYQFENYASFHFTGPKCFENSALRLVLKTALPADPVKQWVPVYHYLIYRKGKRNAVGHVNFRVGNINQITQYFGHIGYHILPPYRGHGLASEACLLLRPLFEHHNYSNLRISCHPENIASKKTICKLGADFVAHKKYDNLPEEWDNEKLLYEWHY